MEAFDSLNQPLFIGDKVVIAPISKYNRPRVVIISSFTDDGNIRYRQYWNSYVNEWTNVSIPKLDMTNRTIYFVEEEKVSTTQYIFKLNN